MSSPSATALLSTNHRAAPRDGAQQNTQQIEQLREQIRLRQTSRREGGDLPTDPLFESLLPGGALKHGAAYSVTGSVTVALALLAPPSAAGAWCGVIGLPDLGVEAAARSGIDLERLVLIPNPGAQWLSVTAAALDVLTVVLTTPNRRLSDSEAARLTARLRGREASLIVLGPWPQSEATVHLSNSSWQGLGTGSGSLTGRRATLTVTARDGTRSRRIWLPQQAASRALPPDGVPRALLPIADPATESPTLRSLRAIAG